MATTRPRGFITWNPRYETWRLIVSINSVLDEYREQLPLTIRQIFYRLVAEYEYQKTEKAYNRLTDIISNARRAKLIDMDCIRDDGFFLSTIQSFTSAKSVIDSYRNHAATVRMDRQAGQKRRLIVWCEAQGMKPMLEGVATDYGVPVASSGGFDSLTTKHNMAKAFAGNGSTEVLHIGDYDPSGVHMFSSLDEDIKSFISHMGGEVEFTRLAVTPDQRDEYNLPTAPPKATDRRKFEDYQTVQCEALAPDVLLGLVDSAITGRLDMGMYQSILDQEKTLQSELGMILG